MDVNLTKLFKNNIKIKMDLGFVSRIASFFISMLELNGVDLCIRVKGISSSE